MKRNKIVFWLVLTVAILLSGCTMRTIDQMYCLPKRPEGYMNLQSALDKAMSDLSYHAPVIGDNRQPVQWKDMDGDGKDECIVFAKGSGEKPLKILIFRQIGEAFVHADTLEDAGAAFEQVQYVHFTDKDGYDLVVSRQISDQGIRPFEVYSMENGKMVQTLTSHSIRFVSTDLNEDGLQELMVLHRGENAAANGSANLLYYSDGQVQTSSARMSVPADSIRRIQVNALRDGLQAVYLTSAVSETAVVTDVVTLVEGSFSNITMSEESAFSEKTLCEQGLFGADLDNDGIPEFPELLPDVEGSLKDQHLVRWFALNSDGTQSTTRYTFHNLAGGWYLELPEEIATTVRVAFLGTCFEFSIPTENETDEPTKLMTVYAFTGQEREELAISENRFVLNSNESTVFAGHLEVSSAAFNMTQEMLINAFHMVNKDQMV